MAEHSIDWVDLSVNLGYANEFEMWNDLYSELGYSINTIARKLGVSNAVVATRIDKLGIPKRSRGGPNSTAKIRTKLHLLDQRLVYHKPIKEIVMLLDTNYTTVWKYRNHRH